MAQQGFQHKYPLDLDAEHFFPESIRFEFNKRLGVNFNDLKDSIQSKMGPTSSTHSERMAYKDDLLNKMNQEISQLDLASIESAQSSYGYAVKDDRKSLVEKYINMYKDKFGHHPNDSWKEEVKRRASIVDLIGPALKEVRRQNSLIDTIGTIYLHMPNNIALSEAAGWGGESLGVVGALTKKGLKGGEGGDVMSKLLGAGVGSAGNVLAAAGGGIVGSVLGKMGIAMGGLLGMVTGGAIQKGGEAAFSVSHNPYMEMMFSGIGFRSFRFDFIFRARNKSEIEMVGKIIKAFRQHSRPTWVGGDLGKSFMNYPQEYKITFMTDVKGNWEPNQHLPKLKECVCSNVETNFTPQSIWSAYDQGAPVSITLGLTFQEKELYMANDVATEWPEPQAKGESSDESARSMHERLGKLDQSMPIGDE